MLGDKKFSSYKKNINGSSPHLAVREKRAASWQNNSEDAATYREYMNEQAEKAAQREDVSGIWFNFYSFFVFLMGFSWTAPTDKAVFAFFLSLLGAMCSFGFYALKLRAALPSARSEGDRR